MEIGVPKNKFNTVQCHVIKCDSSHFKCHPPSNNSYKTSNPHFLGCIQALQNIHNFRQLPALNQSYLKCCQVFDLGCIPYINNCRVLPPTVSLCLQCCLQGRRCCQISIVSMTFYYTAGHMVLWIMLQNSI